MSQIAVSLMLKTNYGFVTVIPLQIIGCMKKIYSEGTQADPGKVPGIDNVHNIILKKAIGTGFYKVWARAFTISLIN